MITQEKGLVRVTLEGRKVNGSHDALLDHV